MQMSILRVSIGDFLLCYTFSQPWMICILSFQVNEAHQKNRFPLDLLDVIWCLVSALNHEFVYMRYVGGTQKNEAHRSQKRKKTGELCVCVFQVVFFRGRGAINRYVYMFKC